MYLFEKINLQNEDHLLLLYNLYNDVDVKRVFTFFSIPFSFDQLIKELAKPFITLNMKIIVFNNIPIGWINILSYESDNLRIGQVSYAISSFYRGKHHSSRIIEEIINSGQYDLLEAEVHRNNTKSLNLLISFGFSAYQIDEENSLDIYRLSIPKKTNNIITGFHY